MEQTLLQLDQLSKNYGSLKAVDQLSITLKKGNIYGLLGQTEVANQLHSGWCLTSLTLAKEVFNGMEVNFLPTKH